MNLEGGIGNQLFQYSAGRYLAEKMNMTLILNSFGISSQRHGGFSIQQIVENAKTQVIYSEKIWKTSINLGKFQKPPLFTAQRMIRCGTVHSTLLDRTVQKECVQYD